MENKSVQENQFISSAHTLWEPKADSQFPLTRQVDKKLKDYFSYPEMEWPKFKVRPPDDRSLSGAWRDSSGSVFIFLLDGQHPTRDNERLIIVTGREDTVSKVDAIIKSLKTNIHKSEGKYLTGRAADSALKEEDTKKSIGKISSALLVFTTIINGFSLLLRKLPPPNLSNKYLDEVYKTLYDIMNILAILLLVLSSLILLFYLFKLGTLIIRRMRT